MEVKTMEGWRASGLSFDDYFTVGSQVDDGVYYYFLEILPPAYHGSTLMQVGEPSSHVAGKPTFSTFKRVNSDSAWVYAGDCYQGQSTPPQV